MFIHYSFKKLFEYSLFKVQKAVKTLVLIFELALALNLVMYVIFDNKATHLYKSKFLKSKIWSGSTYVFQKVHQNSKRK